MKKQIFGGLAILAVIAAGGILIWKRPLGSPIAPASSGTQVYSDSRAVGDSVIPGDSLNTVTLSAEKFESMDIQIAEVTTRELRLQRDISGRLDYDQDRHVAIRSPCDGILVSMLVHPGEQVLAGQTVAVVSSPEVGMARSEVRMRLSELSLAERQQQRQSTICASVEELVTLVDARKTLQEIEPSFQDRALGDYREKLLSAYSRERLAQTLVDNSREAAERGAIAGSTQQIRESEMHLASAALASIADQSLFEVRQQCSASTASLAQAQRLVQISIQRLNALLGPAAEPATEQQFRESEVEPLSHFNLITPIDGTVEDRNFTVSERVRAGEVVFVVADVSELWAIGDIREGDWNAITLLTGQSVQITSPAIIGSSFVGNILRVGRRLDPATGTAPLIANLPVSDGRLRPGLFIRMTVPMGAPRNVLAVPQQAVVVHEGQSFVFISESGFSFRRADVTVGATQDGYTEIQAGLPLGARIAVSGVFALKSELLLAAGED